MPHPCELILDLLTVELVSESCVTSAVCQF